MPENLTSDDLYFLYMSLFLSVCLIIVWSEGALLAASLGCAKYLSSEYKVHRVG